MPEIIRTLLLRAISLPSGKRDQGPAIITVIAQDWRVGIVKHRNHRLPS